MSVSGAVRRKATLIIKDSWQSQANLFLFPDPAGAHLVSPPILRLRQG